MGIFSSKDYITQYNRVHAMLTSMLTNFSKYEDENYFCSSIVAIQSGNNINGIYTEGTLAKINDVACKNISSHFKHKIIIIETAKQCLENAKKIVDALERGQLCPHFIENGHTCGDNLQFSIILNDKIKGDVIDILNDYMYKIDDFIEKNQTVEIEKTDPIKLDIFHKEILTITGNMLSTLQKYYMDVIADPNVVGALSGMIIP